MGARMWSRAGDAFEFGFDVDLDVLADDCLEEGGDVFDDRAEIERAGLDPADVEDVILGCAYPEGATGFNIGRNAAMAAGCPTSTTGATINRYCSSGLQAIALAARAEPPPLVQPTPAPPPSVAAAVAAVVGATAVAVPLATRSESVDLTVEW